MSALPVARDEIFCQEYAKHRHARKAARIAGFSECMIAHTQVILARPYIAGRIREILGVAMNAADITPERVMRELGRIAFADIRDVYDADGNLLPVHELNDDTAATIAGIDVETRYEGKGDQAVPVTVKKIRRVDKMAALNVLAKHFKIVGDEGDGVNALASALADRLNNAKRRMNVVEPTDAEDARVIPRGALPQPYDDPGTIDPTPLTQESDDELWT